MEEDKIYQAIRKVYGYGAEGDKLVDWLSDTVFKAEYGHKEG